MNAAALREKIEDAKARLANAEAVLQKAVDQVEQAQRADKSMVGSALATALSEMKAARQDLIALEKVVAEA